MLLGALIVRPERVWDADHVPDHREFGAVTLRSRDEYLDDEERFAHEYDPGPGRFTRSVRTFIRRYGWRAYALPVLVIVTVVALVTTTTPAHKASKATSPPAAKSPAPQSAQAAVPPTGSGTTELKSDQAGANTQNEALASDVLPEGPDYTKQGQGTFRVLPGTTPVVGSGTVRRYTVDVENGITGVDLTAFAKLVDKGRGGPRSGTGNHSGAALQRVVCVPADCHVTPTSSMTVRK